MLRPAVPPPVAAALLLALVGLAVYAAVPALRRGAPPPAREGGAAAPTGEPRYEIVRVLPRNAIPAVLRPSFVSAREAERRLARDTPVLGVSLNGEHRAYPIPYLSRREVVDDTVGGVQVAVTW